MTRRIEVDNGYIIFSDSITEENTIEIEEVSVKEKRKGTGSELVRKVIEIAQEEGKGLTLCAHPLDDSISTENLVEFYEKLGFTIDYDDGIIYLMKY